MFLQRVHIVVGISSGAQDFRPSASVSHRLPELGPLFLKLTMDPRPTRNIPSVRWKMEAMFHQHRLLSQPVTVGWRLLPCGLTDQTAVSVPQALDDFVFSSSAFFQKMLCSFQIYIFCAKITQLILHLPGVMFASFFWVSSEQVMLSQPAPDRGYYRFGSLYQFFNREIFKPGVLPGRDSECPGVDRKVIFRRALRLSANPCPRTVREEKINQCEAGGES